MLPASASEQSGDSVVCVMKVDLDDFKQVNDTLGHNAGDQLLKHAAAILSDHADPDTLVGRIGGDEFVLLIERPLTVMQIETLADAIGIPAGVSYQSEELWAAADSQGEGEEGWSRYGIESFSCVALIEAARLSLDTGAALVFT